MILNSISILNFKNIVEANLSLSPKVNCFTGKNGMGKTNLLDAIYYLSFCKSYSNQPDLLNITHNAEYMMLQGKYIRNDEKEDISCGLQRGKRKVLKRNGKEYQRLSQHIGLIPLVMISPMDWELIRGGSEERRRLIDQIISQSDKNYLVNLIKYNKSLENRNSLLKQGIKDKLLFETIEHSLCSAAQEIHIARKEWIQKFSPIFLRYYQEISGESEQVSISYLSHLNDYSMKDNLLLSWDKDCAIRYTSKGVHRDDIELLLGDYSMRKIGSQGQCKTYTIALRLAQYDFLRTLSGITPILLLDDIFDKLDASRVENIISAVGNSRFGQIFITDTNRTHLDEIIQRVGSDYKIYSVENGACTEALNSEAQ